MSIVVVALGAAVSQWSNDKQQATDMIAQLQLARAGMLRFNMDYPCSTQSLSALVKREDAVHGGCGDSNDPQSWRGPYIELSNQLISNKDLNVSRVYPESRLTLREATVGNVQYQAIILEGSASSNLRTAILDQCGTDCMPIPGSEELGILVRQSQTAAVDSSELVAQAAQPRPAWASTSPAASSLGSSIGATSTSFAATTTPTGAASSACSGLDTAAAASTSTSSAASSAPTTASPSAALDSPGAPRLLRSFVSV